MRDEHTALDIVQDSMLKLSEKYADRPPEELPMLFQRILQNTIRDYYRRQKVRSMWTTLLSALTGKQDSEGEERDPLETMEIAPEFQSIETPHKQLERAQLNKVLEEGLHNLPARQREAFLLRYWEEMDTAETAAAMGCSEGSVKTHCSRATHAMAAFLKTKGIEP